MPGVRSRAEPSVEARPPAKSRAAPVAAPPGVTNGYDVRALQRTAGNRAVAGYLARKPRRGPPTAADTAKSTLKTSIGGKTAAACKTRLAKRFPKGPLFSPADVGSVQVLEGNAGGVKWLKEAGIGTHQDAMQYLNAGRYQDWLKLEAGKRLLIATLAWTNAIGANDDQPPPSYTLGRAMAIQTGGLNPQAKQLAEQHRDETIRNAFVNTLLSPTAQEELDARGRADDPDETVAAHEQAQHILTRVLLILHAGLQVYDPTAQQGAGAHVAYQGDVVRALAHGGRVNIRIPALRGRHAGDDKYALLKWVGVLDALGHKTAGVKKRDYATHHMDIGENIGGVAGTGTFKETGGKGASASNKTSSDSLLYGVDLAAGGLGKRDFNGDVILPDGAHGHLFIGFTKPTRKKDGALQIGIETTAPGADSLVGYKHDWNSTEATANPESSFFGHKMQKVGSGKLGGSQRLVDLNTLDTANTTWDAHLDQIAQMFAAAIAQRGPGNERGAYERLAGPRLF